jgi:predicted nucleic acid-binding Zn ribbon protein
MSKLKNGSEVLQSLLENGKSPLSSQFLRWKLWAKWSEFVGPTIANNSEPVGYDKGVLYLWVKNSTWMQQFVFMREPIKETVNKKLGQRFIKDIRLTLDKKAVPRSAEESEELKKTLEQLQAQMAEVDKK